MCYCNTSMDIRGHCCYSYHKKDFKTCPARIDTAVFHLKNERDVYCDMENAKTKRSKNAIMRRFLLKTIKLSRADATKAIEYYWDNEEDNTIPDAVSELEDAVDVYNEIKNATNKRSKNALMRKFFLKTIKLSRPDATRAIEYYWDTRPEEEQIVVKPKRKYVRKPKPVVELVIVEEPVVEPEPEQVIERGECDLSSFPHLIQCESCFYKDGEIKVYYECCCEYDRLQVQEDDERARKEGLIEFDGRWIKQKKP